MDDLRDVDVVVLVGGERLVLCGPIRKCGTRADRAVIDADADTDATPSSCGVVKEVGRRWWVERVASVAFLYEKGQRGASS